MAEIQTYELTEGTYNQVLEYMEKSSKKEKSEEGEVEGSIRFVHQLNGSNLYSFNDGGVLIVNKKEIIGIDINKLFRDGLEKIVGGIN
ncbi:MAG: hypothetical protein AABX28_03840 [Nanoarchaeota archaeon]